MMRSIHAGAAVAALFLVTAQAGAATATVTRAWQFKDADPAVLKVENLVGDVRIQRGTAAGFEVSVEVTAEAKSDREAREIADAVEFNANDAGSSSAFQVLLPEARFPMIYRQGAPDGWFSGRMYVDYLGERRRITGDPDEGVSVRVDILVRAPAGARLDVRNVLGDAAADGFAGELRLDGASGRLASMNGSGRLDLDSGSGPVEVSVHSGEVRADTGSGSVSIRDCACRIAADTGSGSVSVTGGEGELDADTGSGGVSVADFKGSVRADTGSGGVRVSGLSGATELVADTGSGSVRVDGDLSGLRRLDIDTGSGSVTLEASAWPAMELVVDTGSGATAIDIPGATVELDDDRRSVVRVGEGGFRGVVDTGSGSIRIRTVP
jgi:hypothetical protein